MGITEIRVRASRLRLDDRELFDYLIREGEMRAKGINTGDEEREQGLPIDEFQRRFPPGHSFGVKDEPASEMPKDGWIGGVSPDEDLATTTSRVHQKASIDWGKSPAWASGYRAKYNHRIGATQAEWFNDFEAQHAPVFFELLASDRGRVLEFKFLE